MPTPAMESPPRRCRTCPSISTTPSLPEAGSGRAWATVCAAGWSAQLWAAEILGRRGERVLYRWQNPSGIRLVIATEGDTVVDFLPSLAAEPGARLADVRTVNQDVAVADVLDDNGAV